MPGITIDNAREGVVSNWRDDGRLREQSIEKFDELMARFVKYCGAFSVAELADVSPDLVERFVRARGRGRRGDIVESAVATMQQRRAVLRGFYRTARKLGLTFDDPARDIVLPQRTSRGQRPLTAEEVELVWMHAWAGGRTTRHASTIALMLAGAHSGEIGHITASDVDESTKSIQVHGASKYAARRLMLDDRYLAALVARRDALAGRFPRWEFADIVLATGAGGSDAHKQARVCVTAAEVLRQAGLGDDPALRPSSITAVAGQDAFARAGRIEDAATTLGLASLDSAARAIGWDWQVGR